MSKLSEFEVTTAQVTLPDGQALTVRGLSLEDLLLLMRSHQAELNTLFQMWQGQAENAAAFVDPPSSLAASGFDSDTVIAGIVNTAPRLVADIIACAADEPGASALARRLPAPVQLDALEKIGDLTFAAAGGPVKLLETVTRMLTGGNSLLAMLTG